MSIRFFGVVGLCVAIMALAGGNEARAQVYLGGEAGWSDLPSQTDHSNGAPTLNERYDAGYALGARLGYQWGPWRFEEEYIYHNNGLDRLAVSGVNQTGASGSRNSHAIMTNAIYDFDLGWPVTPHIGAGVGAVDVVASASAPATGTLINASNWQFGYQAIGGVSYNFSPDLSLDVDYRYLASTAPTFPASGIASTFHTRYYTHNILASLIYHFAAPPPPPVATPAAMPAPPPPPNRRVFLVFFDWDRDTITPQGMHIIEQAADAYKSGAQVRIQVTGYTDRSGSPGYNQRLSERRANHVADALLHFGVPRDQMAVSGRGESDNRVPTAAGVREPQNRRVEIVFP
jgi:outer membrane protein OmpA-like peptidoglycan-associated protein